MTLRTHSIVKRFGGTVALDSVSLEFRSGELCALVGKNGAGKSTLFNVITGLIAPDSGEVTIGDSPEKHITGLTPCRIAQHGIGMLFQDMRLFPTLSVLDNVAVAVPNQIGENPLISAFFRSLSNRRENDVRARARSAIGDVGLSHLGEGQVSSLSYGEQKLVGIARLLASDCTVLLLDEPTSGLHPERIRDVLKVVRRLADDHHKTVIMIEHNLDAVAAVSDTVYWFDRGSVIDHGPPKKVLTARASAERDNTHV